MADYAGSRRAAPTLSAPEQPQAPAAPDAALTCPQCGSFVRADQQWCTLCLHVLHAPEPDPEPEPELPPEARPEAVPQPATVAESIPSSKPSSNPPPSATPSPDPDASSEPAPSRLTPEAEAAAQALLEQLAFESRREGIQVPSYLETKTQKAVAVGVAMTVLSGLAFGVMDILGRFIH